MLHAGLTSHLASRCVLFVGAIALAAVFVRAADASVELVSLTVPASVTPNGTLPVSAELLVSGVTPSSVTLVFTGGHVLDECDADV